MACSRRLFLAGGVAVLAARPASAAEFFYRGWLFDAVGTRGPLADDLARSLRAQIDIVETVNLKPNIREFFRAVPKIIVPSTPTGPGEYDFVKRVLFLSEAIDPPENPVLLHEALHAYHQRRLPDGLSDSRTLGYFDRAKASGKFPPQAYMLANVWEFFAMCVSVTLWGRAARPPWTREKVQEALPDFHAWILVEFRPDGRV